MPQQRLKEPDNPCRTVNIETSGVVDCSGWVSNGARVIASVS